MPTLSGKASTTLSPPKTIGFRGVQAGPRGCCANAALMVSPNFLAWAGSSFQSSHETRHVASCSIRSSAAPNAGGGEAQRQESYTK